MPPKQNLPEIDRDFLLEFLTTLLNTPSPTGYTAAAVDLIDSTLSEISGLKTSATRKGALVVDWPGKNQDHPRGLTAHVDTLGAIVKEIKPSGRLKLSQIGTFAWNTVEGEGCTIFTYKGSTLRGSLLLDKASGHVHSVKVNETKRGDDNMEVRVDARTDSLQDTLDLGVAVGDFVAFDPRVEVVNGFVRSRHLDDKAGVAALVAAVKALHDAGDSPAQNTTFLFSNYEEVGHGAAAGLPSDLEELVAVDMAAVGQGQTSDEFHATLCVKDTGGPYHHGLSQKLRRLAEEHEIPHKVDIYPYYGSDGEAYWRAGGDVAVALIGPGVDASHNYERTHMDALLATAQWIVAYLVH
ncbi:MAG: M42 family metallopeptidase [Anaerolineae bacterium]|nr:M42 family metallopeptidase [Anaerolineae bacterium]